MNTLTRPAGRLSAPLHPTWSLLLAAVLSVLLAGTSFAQPLTPSQKAGLIAKAEELVKERAFASGVDFEKSWPPIREKYQARIDAADDATALTRVLNRALDELGVSHLEVLTPRASERARKSTMDGIGIRSRPTPEGVRIEGLIENAPAERAGLKVGDLIVEVDDRPLMTAEQIAGPAGTKVRLKVIHADGRTSQVDLTRASFSTREPETLEPLGDDAFVLAIPTFGSGYRRDQVEKFLGKARSARRLIIDLRDNGGGDFDNMMHLLSCLLPAGTKIGTQVDRDMSEAFTRDTGKSASDPAAVAEWSPRKSRVRRNPITPFDGDIAVLINGASASASEIVAAALQELRSAPLVGSRTAGAVLVSTYVSAGDGFQMKVPISEWVTIKGRRLEAHPLQPDVAVGRSSRGDTRAARAALERLTAKP